MPILSRREYREACELLDAQAANLRRHGIGSQRCGGALHADDDTWWIVVFVKESTGAGESYLLSFPNVQAFANRPIPSMLS